MAGLWVAVVAQLPPYGPALPQASALQALPASGHGPFLGLPCLQGKGEAGASGPQQASASAGARGGSAPHAIGISEVLRESENLGEYSMTFMPGMPAASAWMPPVTEGSLLPTPGSPLHTGTVLACLLNRGLQIIMLADHPPPTTWEDGTRQPVKGAEHTLFPFLPAFFPL